MFKRIEKRLKKVAEDEELGLDNDTKEMLGMHDTDSDESESESDAESSGDEDDDNPRNGGQEEEDAEDSEPESNPRKRKREREEGDETDDANEGEEDLAGSEAADEEGDDELSQEEEDEEEEAPMSVQEAIERPIYVVSLDPDVNACIICPGKLLKNTTMIEVHISAKAHKRRFTRFTQLAEGVKPDDDPRDLVTKLKVEKKPRSSADSPNTSKRVEKRKAKLAAIKTKRERQEAMKAKAKAQKEKAAQTKEKDPSVSKQLSSPESTPLKKMRKRSTGKNVTAEGDSANIDVSKITLSSTSPAPTAIQEESFSETLLRGITTAPVRGLSDSHRKSAEPRKMRPKKQSKIASTGTPAEEKKVRPPKGENGSKKKPKGKEEILKSFD